MTDIISSVFGIVAAATALMSMQFKSIKLSLLFQVICNVAGALSFIVVGGISGCGLSVVAIAQSLVFLLMRMSEKEPPAWLGTAFAGLFLVVSAMTFEVLADVFSMLAALACALALAQKRSSNYRVFLLLNGVMWMAYDIFVCAYGMIPSHLLTVASALIGMIRIDIPAARKNKNAKVQ